MRLKTSDGIELYYETYGDEDDKPLVLAHGLGAEGGMWRPQIEHYPSEGLFLIVPHVRGHGKTSKVKEFRIGDCARDIKELLDHLGVDRANLAGVSMGGVIVQQFACDFPDRAEKLVIADSFSEVSGLLDRLRGWSQWLTIKLAPGLLVKSLGSVYGGSGEEKALKYFRETYAKMDKGQLLKARAALNRFDITDQLERVEAPALVLVGDGFGDAAISWARKTADLLRNSRLTVLDGGKDPSNLVVPDAFDLEVLSFLKK
ncbi:alpha/beta fold hydrolase [Candidatus Bipolaricaulota bacterium]|nr:alpha/beta fold hydrolase [Candidatus Bipolaricaulota bacterium]MBS3792517.1 alpha/beta fold hydrolase [Candidatus Bipolaricaulota bacterium]